MSHERMISFNRDYFKTRILKFSLYLSEKVNSIFRMNNDNMSDKLKLILKKIKRYLHFF